MQNVSAISFGDLAATQMANTGRTAGSGGSFQTYMGAAGDRTASAGQQTPVSETKVSQGTKTSETVAGQETDYSDSAAADSGVVSTDIRTQDTPDGTMTESELTAVEQVVREAVKDVLKLDDAAFEEALAAMGITPIQLLDPSVLQEFVIAVNPGSDVTDFLTSESMLGQFTDVLQALDAVDWEALTGMTEQEFAAFLEHAGSDGDGKNLVLNPEEAVEGQLTEELPEMAAGTGEEQSAEPKDLSGWTESSREDQSPEASLQDTGTVSETEDVLSGFAAGEEPASQTEVVSDAVSKEIRSDQPQNPTEVVETAEEAVAGISSTRSAETDTLGQQAQSQLSQREGQPLPAETQPQSVTTVAGFVENMMQAVSGDQAPESVNMQQMIDIVNQVVEQIHSSMEEGATTLEMQLNPESLGKLLLSVTNKDGVMTASFTVQTTEAKLALESQMITLRDTLEQKNLKVEAVEVSVSDFAFSQSGEADTGDQKEFSRGNGRRARFRYVEEGEEEDSAAEAETVRRSVMRDNGSSIDFTA